MGIYWLPANKKKDVDNSRLGRDRYRAYCLPQIRTLVLYPKRMEVPWSGPNIWKTRQKLGKSGTEEQHHIGPILQASKNWQRSSLSDWTMLVMVLSGTLASRTTSPFGYPPIVSQCIHPRQASRRPHIPPTSDNINECPIPLLHLRGCGIIKSVLPDLQQEDEFREAQTKILAAITMV
jgi:hypothetical protein